MLSWRLRNPEGSARDSALFDEDVQRKLEVLSLVSRKMQRGQHRAERRTQKSGSGIEFADHRAYSPGDDFRFLDWKVFGRSDRLLLKQFEEEEDLSVHLLLDASASMGLGTPPKLDYARQVVAALGYVALAGLDRVGVQVYSDELGARMPPARGKARALRLLRFLEGIEAGGGTHTSAALRKFAAREPRRGLAIVVSDAYDASGFREGINSLRYAKFDTVVLQIVDPGEAQPPLRGDVSLLDVETGEQREVTVTPALLARYREAYHAQRRALADFCRDKQVPCFALPIDVPFDEAVLTLLRSGGVVR